jgi:sortase (surface protein transpeptidase)
VALGCALPVLIFLTPESYLNKFEETPLIVRDPAVPVLLSIERIGVYAPVEFVGIVNGVMESPIAAEDVGWYSLGTRPGEIGSAVFAGHVNWSGGKDAVFADLHTMQIGDLVSVTNNYGETDQFITRAIKQYPKDADASEVFISYDGLSHVNLITCDGEWNTELNTHDSRLVVFTEKI